MDADTELNRLTDGRPEAFFTLLKERAKELAPDYPYTTNDAFEYLWAITSSLEGASLACDDWYKRWLRLVTALERLLVAADFMLDGWKDVRMIAALRLEWNEVQKECEEDLRLLKAAKASVPTPNQKAPNQPEDKCQHQPPATS